MRVSPEAAIIPSARSYVSPALFVDITPLLSASQDIAALELQCLRRLRRDFFRKFVELLREPEWNSLKHGNAGEDYVPILSVLHRTRVI
jgi:hypothetical protein